LAEDASLPSPEALAKALQDEQGDKLRAAFAPLLEVTTLPAEYRPVLWIAIKHEEGRVRLAAALGLLATGEKDELVIKEILAPLATVRRSYLPESELIAERALARHGARAVPILRAALKHESREVRYHGLRTVDAIGPPARELLPEVTRWIDMPEGNLWRYAVMAKWRLDGDGPAAARLLAARLGSQEKIEVKMAAVAVARLGADAKEALPALIAAMKKDKEYLVIHALMDLAPHFRETIVAAFREVLDETDRSEQIAGALLHCDGPKEYLLPHLTQMMNRDGDRAVERHELARVLGTYGPAAAPAVPGLIRMLASPSGQTRINAAEALGLIGPAAKDALPALEKSKDDREVVAYAVQAIGRIRGKEMRRTDQGRAPGSGAQRMAPQCAR
jgi:HEAT repeat protein